MRDGSFLFSFELSFNAPNIESEFEVTRVWFIMSGWKGLVQCFGFPTLKPGTIAIDMNSKCWVPKKGSRSMLQIQKILMGQ